MAPARTGLAVVTDLLAVRATRDELLHDLVEEQRTLCDDVRAAGAAVTSPTSAPPWDLGDQCAHLAHGDELATSAVRDGDAFAAELQRLLSTGDLDAAVASEMASRRGADLDGALLGWRRATRVLVDAASGLDVTDRVPWVMGTMSLGSLLQARLMEYVAHGQDIRDGLGSERPASARDRHVAQLGVRAFGLPWTLRGETPPDTPVRVVLHDDDGEWTWGPEDAADTVTGSVRDFALLVTRRRHPDDTDIVAVGDTATTWVAIAQCYAGPPAPIREPGAWRVAREQATP